MHVSFSLFKWTYFSSHFCLLFWIVVRHCKFYLLRPGVFEFLYSWALFWQHSKVNWKQFGSLGSCKMCLGIVMVAGARLGDGGWRISSRPGYPDLHEILFQDITITTITTPKREPTEDLLGRTRPVFRQWLILPKYKNQTCWVMSFLTWLEVLLTAVGGSGTGIHPVLWGPLLPPELTE